MRVQDEPHEAPDPGPGFMLWQVTNGWQRVTRAALAPTGLTYVQLVLLSGLKDKLAEGAAVSQAALAQTLGADPMMTSQVLRTLETAGLVKRERNPVDTRARRLSLTAVGEAQLAAALPLIAEVDRHFFEILGRREDRFLKAMRRLWRKQRLVESAAEPKPAVPEKQRPARRKAAPAG
jgi:DNA-binding MarR family transcriptional regulator